MRQRAEIRFKDHAQFALAGHNGGRRRPEDAGHCRGLDDKTLVGALAPGEHDSQLALRDRFEVGESRQMRRQRCRLADDQGRELQKKFRLVGELGQGFRLVVGLHGGRWLAAVVVFGGGFVAARRQEQGHGDKARHQCCR